MEMTRLQRKISEVLFFRCSYGCPLMCIFHSIVFCNTFAKYLYVEYRCTMNELLKLNLFFEHYFRPWCDQNTSQPLTFFSLGKILPALAFPKKIHHVGALRLLACHPSLLPQIPRFMMPLTLARTWRNKTLSHIHLCLRCTQHLLRTSPHKCLSASSLSRFQPVCGACCAYVCGEETK